MMMATPWLVRRPGPAGRLRLYCFSYAGGSAATFSEWQPVLGPDIEVCAIQLPGRGARLAEAAITSLPDLVQMIAAVTSSQGNGPFAFFGHSLGGLLAFETARYCKLHRLPMPQHLIVSGSAAPRQRDTSRQLHLLGDQELIDELRKYNGTPPAVLENRELMELLLPMIRADFSLVERYRYRAGALLDMPIAVLAGRADPHVSPAQAQGWASETTAGARVHWVDGDHFFVNAKRTAVLDCVREVLLEQVCG